MAWYRTGTVTINNSATVNGSGTAFVANARAGDAFVVNGVVYEILAVVSDTVLTLATTFSGSVTGAAYQIAPVQGYLRDLANQVNALLTAYGALYDANNDRISLKELALKNWSSNPPGTVAVPAIRRDTTDTDTGIYWSADNELSVAAGGVRGLSVTPTGINNTPIGATTPNTGAFSTLTTTGQLTVGGNLVVNGTTTTVNATTTTLDDPIITLGGDTAPTVDDNKDRGVEFRWHNGTVAKVGFFGYDDSTGKFTFIPDVTNASEVMSGTAGPASFGALDVTTLSASGLITATGGLTVFDSTFLIKDNTDNTKVVKVEVGSLTTGTTRTLTVQDLDGQVAVVGSSAPASPRNGDLGSAAYVDAATLVGTSAPTTVGAASYTVGADTWIIANFAGTCTLTLPNAANFPGRCLTVKTLTANTVVSASANVAPLTSVTAGTAILAATAGKWARLVSDGTNWIAMEGN